LQTDPVHAVDGKTCCAPPLLIVPPWNQQNFYILDLKPEKKSYIKWCVGSGHHGVFVISWVNPDKEARPE